MLISLPETINVTLRRGRPLQHRITGQHLFKRYFCYAGLKYARCNNALGKLAINHNNRKSLMIIKAFANSIDAKKISKSEVGGSVDVGIGAVITAGI